MTVPPTKINGNVAHANKTAKSWSSVESAFVLDNFGFTVYSDRPTKSVLSPSERRQCPVLHFAFRLLPFPSPIHRSSFIIHHFLNDELADFVIHLPAAVAFEGNSLDPFRANHIHKARDKRPVENQSCRGPVDLERSIPNRLRAKDFVPISGRRKYYRRN